MRILNEDEEQIVRRCFDTVEHPVAKADIIIEVSGLESYKCRRCQYKRDFGYNHYCIRPTDSECERKIEFSLFKKLFGDEDGFL